MKRQPTEWEDFFFFLKGEREIFGFIENGSWRKKRRQPRCEKEEKALCEETGLCYLRWGVWSRKVGGGAPC